MKIFYLSLTLLGITTSVAGSWQPALSKHTPNFEWVSYHSSNLNPQNFKSQQLLTQTSSETFYKQGIEKFEQLDFSNAINDFTQAIQQNPKYVEAYVFRSVVYLTTPPQQKALPDLNKALQIDPNHILAHSLRAAVLLNENRFSEAKQDQEKALSLPAKTAQDYLGRSLAKLVSLNEQPESNQVIYRDAISEVDQAIKLDPNYVYAYLVRGVLRQEGLQDNSGTLADFNLTIERHPKVLITYLLRGLFYQEKLKNPAAALTDFNEVIRLNPNYSQVYQNRGEIYFDLKDYEKAIADYERYVTLTPNQSPPQKLSEAQIGYYSKIIQQDVKDSNAYLNRGIAYFNLSSLGYLHLSSLGNDYTQKAIADLTEVIRLNPNNAEAYLYRGMAGRLTVIYDSKIHLAAVIADLTEAIRLNPNSDAAYFQRGEMYLFEGESQKAIDDFTAAIRLNPIFTEAYRQRAYTRRANKEYSLAIADYTEIIRIKTNEQHPDLDKFQQEMLKQEIYRLYIERGNTYRQMADYPAAIADYTEAIRWTPISDSYPYVLRADVRLEMKNYLGAIADYSEALEQITDNPKIYYNRAEAYTQTGEKSAAIKDYQKAAELFKQQENMTGYQDAIERIINLQK